MGQNIYVFEVELNLLGTDTLYKKIHLLAHSLFQASHIAYEYVYDGESDFKSDSPVEVGTIRRIPGIQNILNPEFFLEMMENDNDENTDGYNPKIPFEMLENVGKNDDNIISFKHSCGQDIRCVNFGWPYIICPNEKCQKKILHKDIEEVGGIYLFTGLDDDKK